MRVLHPPREDGSFVIEGPFGPYHVVHDDPLFAEASAAYEAQVAAGETPPPEPGPPPLDLGMPTLTARQLRLALLSLGVQPGDVDAAIYAISDPQSRLVAQIEWQHATVFTRDHPLIGSLAAVLLPNLSSEALDAAWRSAAAI